jgi:Phage integrase family
MESNCTVVRLSITTTCLAIADHAERRREVQVRHQGRDRCTTRRTCLGWSQDGQSPPDGLAPCVDPSDKSSRSGPLPICARRAQPRSDLSASKGTDTGGTTDRNDGPAARCAQAGETNPFYRLKWIFARGCGFRDDEIRHIAKDDFLVAAAGLYVVKVAGKPIGFCRCHVPGKHETGFEPKRHHKRTVPISKNTYEAGLELIEKYEYQLRDPDTKRTWSQLRLTCAHAGVPAISMHDFRYNWASHLYASGKVTLEQVSRWLGHKDTRTTELYLRVVDLTLLHSDKLPF